MSIFLNAEDLERARRTDREMIPRRLVIAMFSLALITLALVTFAVLTDRPTVGQPKAAEVVEARDVILSGTGNAARVTETDGTLILDLPEGGFITAVRSGLLRERTVHGVSGNPPVTVARLANGRLTLSDPATGWRVELTNFGDANTAAWLPVLEGPGS